MEKELGLPKPGDLFIGVVDFFAILVPGVLTAVLIVNVVGASLHPDVFFVSGLVIAGWVLGHVLEGIGSVLDPLILGDTLFKPWDNADLKAVAQQPALKPSGLRARLEKYLHKNDDLYRLAKKLTDFPGPEDFHRGYLVVPGGMYQWARAYLSSRRPEVIADLNRLEADSKLFRSLAVLLLLWIPVRIAIPHLRYIPSDWQIPAHPHWLLTVLAAAGVVFSLWRYIDLRSKMIRRCYLHYVQLRFESQGEKQP
jgi:hypothetical protein